MNVPSFIRCGCISPKVTVADCDANADEIIAAVHRAARDDVSVLALPELCITGYTCGDLFLQNTLLNGAASALRRIADETADTTVLFAVGLPVSYDGCLFNCAAFVQSGTVLALIPKSYIPNYAEFYEVRHFTGATEYFTDDDNLHNLMIPLYGFEGLIPFGPSLLLSDIDNPDIRIGAEICEDVWVPQPPSVNACLAGATIMLNLSASNEVIGKAGYRSTMLQGHSGRLCCAYLYANAGNGESTTDMIFDADNLILENGTLLARSSRFTDGYIYQDIDIERLTHERRKMNTFIKNRSTGYYGTVSVQIDTRSAGTGSLARFISPSPFVPGDTAARKERCAEIIAMQAEGLSKRLRHTHCKSAVIGLSGGLDSTLALLVTLDAFKRCGLDTAGISAVTMPGFGTTDRTYTNACTLAKETGCTLSEISIAKAVTQHFADIGHDPAVHDVTYENSQARERTQILMDLANQSGGMVIGTGDLSELALGWATYNGDHMSMYGVNASIPKTLVRYLVSYYADLYDETDHGHTVATVLRDILDTPVSPELLPPENGKISQKTEDLVGPYDLHDFFLYYVMRWGFAPAKIYGLAKQAFAGTFDDATILKWLKTFYRRFFNQQFKRSCLPDGAKVGTVSLSPRGDWRMPSDASSALWLTELEKL